MQPRISNRSLFLVGGYLVLLLLNSCSSKDGVKLYPVHGKVMFNDKPTEGALVTLYAQNPASKMSQVPTAYVKADGTFAIGTLEPEDGAPAGDYKVSILWFPPDARARSAEGGAVANLLPANYGSPTTSGLQIQVKEQPNEVPAFQLKSKQ
jgi:hypothetical protein